MSALNPTPTPPPKEHVPRVDFGRSWHKFSKRKPTSLTELFLKSKERKGIFTHECRLSCGTRVTERLERLCCCSVWLLLFARPGQVKSIRIILPYHFPFWGIKLPRLSFVPLPRASESELCPRRCAIAYKRNPANSICPTPTWILSVLPFSLNCAICLPGSLLPLAFFLVRFFFRIFFFRQGSWALGLVPDMYCHCYWPHNKRELWACIPGWVWWCSMLGVRFRGRGLAAGISYHQYSSL